MHRKITFSLVFALICAGLLLSSCGKKAEIPQEGALVDSVLSADSVMIVYSVQGQGAPALVFVHGLGLDRSTWDQQVDYFKNLVTVVTIDLAGHGQSAMNREKWTMDAFGQDVAAVVNKLGLKRLVLVGHSMGGPVILEAAKRLPGKVIGLVGVDNFNDLGKKMGEEQYQEFLAPFKENFSESMQNFVRQMFPEGADSALVERVAAEMASAPPRVALGCFEGLFEFDAEATVGEVRLPIICINSDLWPTNVEGNEELAASYELILMPGRGHFPHLEDPQTFNQNLASAVQRLVAMARGGERQ